MTERIDALARMLERRPDDARLLFGLALEYMGAERWPEAVDALRRYLTLAEDEGNAWGRLGEALRRTGREPEARQAYEQGIDAAERNGHPTMAEEFRDVLRGWPD